MNYKRNERRLCGATLTNTEALQTYYTFLLLQVVGSRAGRNGEVNKQSYDCFHQRPCVTCNVPVDNSDLAGHSRKSALAGPLWCYHCAN